MTTMRSLVAITVYINVAVHGVIGGSDSGIVSWSVILLLLLLLLVMKLVEGLQLLSKDGIARIETG